SGWKFPPQTLTKELKRRLYRRRNTTASLQEGEFRIVGDRLDVVSRSFHTPLGEIVPSQEYSYDFLSGELLNHDNPRVTTLWLEPEPLGPLFPSERRAEYTRILEEIPLHVQQAIIAIEDERFYAHYGIDFVGIGRALVQNILARRIVQGGSTLTQQLAKNLFLSPERTIKRKILELLAALSLERRFEKNKILELYLNEVYLGQEGGVALHGVESAARAFFHKNIKDVTLEEGALLAGIIQAPSYYNPRKHPSRAKQKRDLVLRKMEEAGYITQQEASRTQSLPITVEKGFIHAEKAPFFAQALRGELSKVIHLEATRLTGAHVYTGLSLGLQQCAEQAVEDGLGELEKLHPRLTKKKEPLEVGLVAISPYSGLVRAWVGGRNFKVNQFDHVMLAQRQIGSTAKPFVYLTALDDTLNSYKVATARSILADEPISLEQPDGTIWEPENYDKKFRGDVTLRYALEHSINLPAIFVARRAGLPSVSKTFEAFGIHQHAPAVPSLALGSIESSLLQLTAAYGGLANNGLYTHPRLFREMTDLEGTRYATSIVRERQVSQEAPTYVLTNILQGVIERGTGRAARAYGFSGEAAGKTGTTNETRDAWFIGYTPTLVAGVWLGYDSNAKVGLTGGASAAHLWGRFMGCAEAYLPPLQFLPPKDIIVESIDTESGELATSDCPQDQVIQEIFVRGTEPLSPCSKHGSRRFDSQWAIDEDTPYAEPNPTRSRSRIKRKGFWEYLFGK
ncbi:MAG: PBP1A family penicillin-binding protein, partial [Bdellovibrionales bacterium]|nr:PBP1A family penicillin-binding protein [Bdellovibrionales bacterium]